MQNFLHTTHPTVAWFKKAADEGTLEMSPPFQRNPVWTDAQKSYLIDTILYGYPVPEIYMQEVVDAIGGEQHILVDGQQRIRACLEFIEGKFAINPKDSPRWADMTFDDLSAAERQKLFSHQFVVRMLPATSEQELRNIFQRLNRNVVALNAQELRHATYWGEFISSMEGLGEHPFWVPSGLFTANDFRRMLDIEFISELAVGYLHGPQNKKTSLNRWYEVYEEVFEERDRVENVFETVLGELSQVLPDMKKTRWSKKSDFYSLFLVFGDYIDAFPLAREQRSVCRETLVEFGEMVSSYLSKEEDEEVFLPEVRRYGIAVERAATDLANRKTRNEVLRNRLKGALDPGVIDAPLQERLPEPID